MDELRVAPVDPRDVPKRTVSSTYPEPFKTQVGEREKRVLGDLYGLKNFGVQHVTLAPGGQSALKHGHAKQDEFVVGMAGELTVIVGEERFPLRQGDVVGFPAGGSAHHIVNEGNQPGAFIVAGDRTTGDEVTYPDDDLIARDVGGTWQYGRKDGTPY